VAFLFLRALIVGMTKEEIELLKAERVDAAKKLIRQAENAKTYERRNELIALAQKQVNGMAPIKAMDRKVREIKRSAIEIDGVPLPKPSRFT
jgi:hypothetical protein